MTYHFVYTLAHIYVYIHTHTHTHQVFTKIHSLSRRNTYFSRGYICISGGHCMGHQSYLTVPYVPNLTLRGYYPNPWAGLQTSFGRKNNNLNSISITILIIMLTFGHLKLIELWSFCLSVEGLICFGIRYVILNSRIGYTAVYMQRCCRFLANSTVSLSWEIHVQSLVLTELTIDAICIISCNKVIL